MVQTRTPNFRIPIPAFNEKAWHDEYEDAMRTVDAFMAKYIASTGVRGLWEAFLTYAIDDVVVDPVRGSLYVCEVAHTSSGATLEAYITANPTHWSPYSLPARSRGVWTALTEYLLGDIVSYNTGYYIANQTHTSAAAFDTTKWNVLIDFTTTNVPAASVPTAGYFTRINDAGTSWEAIAPATARTKLGLGSIALLASPLGVADGGTGATGAGAARNNLGLGTIATLADPLPLGNGGTGSTTAATARTALGLGGLAVLSTVGTAELTADAVTYAKIQNIATNQRLLGRTSGAGGDTEELSIVNALDWLLTTRGDLIVRGSANSQRLALGAANQFLGSDATDAVWKTGGLPLLGTLTASASAALNIVSMYNNSLYSGYLIVLESLLPATDNVSLSYQSSIDNGSTYLSTATYAHTRSGATSTPANIAAGSTGDTSVILGAGLSNAAVSGAFGGFLLISAGGAAANAHRVNFAGNYMTTGGAVYAFVSGGGGNSTASQVTAGRLIMSAGNITSGVARIYGIPK